MAVCELIEKCIFFNDKMANLPATADMYKMAYCRGSSGVCARHMVFKALGREKVPENLYPNQTDIAERIIAAEQKK